MYSSVIDQLHCSLPSSVPCTTQWPLRRSLVVVHLESPILLMFMVRVSLQMCIASCDLSFVSLSLIHTCTTVAAFCIVAANKNKCQERLSELKKRIG